MSDSVSNKGLNHWDFVFVVLVFLLLFTMAFWVDKKDNQKEATHNERISVILQSECVMGAGQKKTISAAGERFLIERTNDSILKSQLYESGDFGSASLGAFCGTDTN